MQTETFADAVTPVLAETRPVDARMHLTGTVRQRGADYMIEEQIDVDSGGGPHWTTQRIRRLRATDETREAVRRYVDQVVTISGTPGCGDERNRTSIVLDSIRLLDREPSLG